MKRELVLQKIVVFMSPICYLFACNACLCVTAIQVILNIENTPQAYPAVRRCEAQTGGFIISGGYHAL